MSVARIFRRVAGLEGTTNYVVLVTDGVEFAERGVVAISGYNEGLVLHYRNAQDKIDVVFVPKSYRPINRAGKLFVGKRLGNSSACKLFESDGKKYPTAVPIVGPPTDRDCPGEDLSALVRAHAIALGFKALYDKSIPWKLIIILGVILVVVIGIVAFVIKRGGIF